MSKKGVAFQQGHVASQETPTYAILWNLDGLPRREGDVGPNGLPAYLGGSPPPGRPLPDTYNLDKRPCGFPSLYHPADPPAGSAVPVAGSDLGALEAHRMWQGMVDARPAHAPRLIVGSKKHATFLASTVRQQALPLADRALYLPT